MKNICYLIPYYNSFEELERSLASLVENVDVVIVDDGSNVPLASILNTEEYDFSIHVITAPENGGIERALNIGLGTIGDNYTYVARLDCGDLSSADRITKQVDYLDKNNDYIMVGSWARFVDEQYNELFINELPINDAVIRKKMYLNNMFMHPSVLMRTSALKEVGGYPENRKAAEDYALFFKLLRVGKVANLPEALIDYVVAENSISSKKRTLQIISRLKVILDNKRLNIHCVYGLLRSLAILIIPRKITTHLRKVVKVY